MVYNLLYVNQRFMLNLEMLLHMLIRNSKCITSQQQKYSFKWTFFLLLEFPPKNDIYLKYHKCFCQRQLITFDYRSPLYHNICQSKVLYSIKVCNCLYLSFCKYKQNNKETIKVVFVSIITLLNYLGSIYSLSIQL